MTSKVQLGVQKKKKKPTTKRNAAAKWVHKVANYLKSDYYLYGPLLNPPLTTANGFPSPKVSFPEVGLEFMVRGRKSNQGFGRTVVEYLKSDSYLYGPLMSPRSTIPGYVRRTKKLTLEMLTRKVMRKLDDQSTVEKSNVTVEQEEEFCDVVVLPLPTPERNRSPGQQQQKSVHRRQVVSTSHVVRRRSGRDSSSPSAVSGKNLPNTRLRTRLVDH